MKDTPRKFGQRAHTEVAYKVAPAPRPVAFVSWDFTDYVSMALCMGDNRVGDTSGQLAMPQEMGLARRGSS